MNDQEIFNTIARHLFKQGQQAKNSKSSSCAYRGKNGLKCAIGCLFPDKGVYTPKMEGTGIGALLAEYERFPAARRLFKENNTFFLVDMQDCHDSSSNWWSTDNMKAHLKKIALRYGLDYSVLNELRFVDR